MNNKVDLFHLTPTPYNDVKETTQPFIFLASLKSKCLKDIQKDIFKKGVKNMSMSIFECLLFILFEWEQNGNRMSTAPAGSKVGQNQLSKMQKINETFQDFS